MSGGEIGNPGIVGSHHPQRLDVHTEVEDGSVPTKAGDCLCVVLNDAFTSHFRKTAYEPR